MSLLDTFRQEKNALMGETSVPSVLSFLAEIQNVDAAASEERLLKIALSVIAQAEKTIDRQQQQIDTLKRLSTLDEDTGILNKRGFHRQLKRVLADAQRYGISGVLIICDLDHFKTINDTHGHLAGDKVLRDMAELIQKFVRRTDIVARIGGDEFAILMMRTTVPQARKRLKVLNAHIRQHRTLWNDEDIITGASFGFARFDKHSQELDLIARADHDLYRHKKERLKKQRRSRIGLKLVTPPSP